jgi:hypothetical protein
VALLGLGQSRRHGGNVFGRNRNFYVLKHSAFTAIPNIRKGCEQLKITRNLEENLIFIWDKVDRVHFDLASAKIRE